MNKNDKSEKKSILVRPASDLLVKDVIIVSLETNVAGNNVNVSWIRLISAISKKSGQLL
ncbi:hypothetical protein [Xenorhabdus bovienii]|uniref:hypothetical protein n=1 Tax=Xenorhabdus bovienii TaxID=40576 RepID=UPI0012D35E46|nr:hypothetical protein [Xenorhabdus bovienii]